MAASLPFRGCEPTDKVELEFTIEVKNISFSPDLGEWVHLLVSVRRSAIEGTWCLCW